MNSPWPLSSRLCPSPISHDSSQMPLCPCPLRIPDPMIFRSRIISMALRSFAESLVMAFNLLVRWCSLIYQSANFPIGFDLPSKEELVFAIATCEGSLLHMTTEPLTYCKKSCCMDTRSTVRLMIDLEQANMDWGPVLIISSYESDVTRLNKNV